MSAFAGAAPSLPPEPLLQRWRYELRAALICAAVIGAAGLVVALIWGLLAPPQKLFVVRANRGIPLTGEDQHPFDGLALFMFLTAAAGVLAAATVWRWRQARGPIMVAGLLLGSALGSVVAQLAGEYVASLHYPQVDSTVLRSMVVVAPELPTWAALVVQPLAAALVVLFAAAVSPWDDLGVRPEAAGSAAPGLAGQTAAQVSSAEPDVMHFHPVDVVQLRAGVLATHPADAEPQTHRSL